MGGWADFLPNALVKRFTWYPVLSFWAYCPLPPNFWPWTSKATATVQQCKHFCFAKRGTQSAYPFSILCSHLIFPNPLPCCGLRSSPKHKKQSLRLSSPPHLTSLLPSTLTFQHLFLLCKKINKRHCWQTSENQQESMQHFGCRYSPDGNLISGNKQNPESQSRKHPPPLSHWIVTQRAHAHAHTHPPDPAHFMQEPFPDWAHVTYT